jgi:hyperosmotically inducible periplasmic protein
MNFIKKSFLAVTVLMLSLPIIPVAVASDFQESQQPPADNTKTNQRDRDKSAPTADQQKVNPDDREITRNIRASVHKDKTLSTYAHNIKIITQSGKVTLKGPVRSDEEKANIAAKAIAVAGDGNVDNQLDVVPPKK